MTKFEVWYFTNTFGRDAMMGASWLKERELLPTVATLETTHRRLGLFEANDLEDLFHKMQGHVWSPNGEARELIESLGDVWHTSMSVGDVVIGGDGKAHMVDTWGFQELPK